MDREISNNDINKKKVKTGLWVAFAVVAMAVSAWILRGSLKTSVKQNDIRTAVAELGSIENTLTASGEVQPEFEQVITSPITAIIQNVLLNEGANVKKGERILELDKEFTRLNFEKQKDQLDLKRNSIVKLKLDLDRSFFDLKINDSIKAFRINALNADVENAKRLFKAGGGTRETIEKADNDLHIAQLEKRQLENDLRTRQAIMQSSIRETEISASIQEKELKEFERKLQQADILTTRAGVLTYINKNIGLKVNEGEVLARLADLASFKIIGSISDNYASQIRLNMPVVVRINNETVRGTITNINPSVSNNVLTFDVRLDNQNNAQFRPKMKVEVFLVTDSRTKIVRVANGAAFKGGSSQDIFVVRTDGKLERRTVKIGLQNFDFVEITEGVRVGEKVVISDMSSYKNVHELDIK
jgi:HlyD family secretion protein